MNKTTENNQRTMPSIVKDAFRIHAHPFPWKKAIGSGVASGFPVLIGALAGHTDYGLTASIGGFVYLYAGGESYKKRALKLLLVSIGIALSFGLGTLLSGTVWMMAAVLGLIGAAVMFIFSALGIQGPAPMFFVLSLVSSGLPADPSQALFRAGLTFLGGIFAMGIALIGWLWSKHGPEEAVLQKTYHQLAACLSAVGTSGFHNAQHQTVLMLRTARQTVLGKGNRKKNRSMMNVFSVCSKRLTTYSLLLFIFQLKRQTERRHRLKGHSAKPEICLGMPVFPVHFRLTRMNQSQAGSCLEKSMMLCISL